MQFNVLDREFPTCDRSRRVLPSSADAVSPTGSLVHLKAVLYISAAFYEMNLLLPVFFMENVAKMMFNEMLYAGIEFSSGSRPFIYAALDQDLNVVLLERYSASKVMTHLRQHENVMLAVNVSFRSRPTSNGNGHRIFDALENEIIQAGFKPYLSNHACRQWVETYPFDCFSSLSGQALLPRSTMRGRVQRAEILYEQGLRINAPRKFFGGMRNSVVNMTREALYTSAELDALMAASVAWMLINKPVNIDLTREPEKQMISIPREEKDWWRKRPVALQSM